VDHLRRELAPLSDKAWEAVESEASRTLRHFLAARPLVDFTGPQGWDHSAQSLGRVLAAVPSPAEGVVADVRQVQPLMEVRTPFVLALEELDAVDRGAKDPELTPLTDAARLAALAEDRAVFLGYPAASITGMVAASPYEPEMIGEDYDEYPGVVARAVATLRRSGIAGPYAIAMGPRCYTGVVETTEHGGYPVLEHIKMILGGPVVWAPAVDGAVVVSRRGGDFELVCGQDFSIGYRTHTEDAVELFFEESITFLVQDPRAAVSLHYP
jgi:uncharacterized linocin/CFP29 family protein